MRRRFHPVAVLGAAVLALLFVQWTARSAPPDPATPVPSATAISAVRWTDEVSKVPSLDEWKSAEELSARGGAAKRCRVRRVREWIRIRCLEGNTLEVQQIAGPQVQALGVEAPPGAYAGVGSGGAVFPARRGDRRVLQWLVPRYTSVVESESGIVLTEQWLAEEAGPTITIDDVEQHRGPVTGY